MKTRVLVSLAAVAMLFSATMIVADEIDLEDVKCVIANRDAKAETAVDYKGGQVFFCCNNCAGKFKEDNEEYLTSANRQLAETGQAEQVKCPISGRGLNEDHVAEVAGVEVTFCCPNCKGRVNDAEDEEALELVFGEEAFEKGFETPEDEDDDDA